MDNTVDPDAIEAGREFVLEALVGFVRRLRRAGVDVPTNASIVAAQALTVVGFDDREQAHTALCSTLVTSEDDVSTFDELFPTFWQRLTSTQVGVDEPVDDPANILGEGDRREPTSGSATNEDESEGSSAGMELGISRLVRRKTESQAMQNAGGRYSAVPAAVPITVDDSDEGTDDEAVTQFAGALRTLQGRRSEPSAAGQRPDVRRALRRSFGTGGTIVSIPRRERTTSELRVCLLLDVSRSVFDVLNRRFLVWFSDRLAAESRSFKVFLFDTDANDVTNAFQQGGASAFEVLERAETTWGGGTRIGNALHTVRSTEPHAVDRRTVIIIVSDGLDVGEIDLLEAELSHLTRNAAATVWLNPLAGSPGYKPTCRGMAAALPYVDGFYPFTSPTDLPTIAREINLYGPSKTITKHGMLGDSALKE